MLPESKQLSLEAEGRNIDCDKADKEKSEMGLGWHL